ncbi:type II secretion system protein [Patescibacteria group bacterium]|nr:type II secretion system protein [Patescibacteria group bacterium]
MKLLRRFPSIKGFTIIELLVVIAILGVLITFGINLWQRAVVNARDATREQDLNQVKTALELYFDENGSYTPSNSGDIGCEDVPGGRTISWGIEFECFGIRYMKRLPRDPIAITSHHYCYVASGATPDSFELWADMENDNNSNTSDSPPAACMGYDYVIVNSN